MGFVNIEGYENYGVNRLGEVINFDTGRIKKLSIGNRGYITVLLSKKNVQKRFLVHRLVAMSFKTKIEGKELVNHINGLKYDNRADNLEWTDYTGNMIHAYKTNLRVPSWLGKKSKEHHSSKPVRMLDLNGNILREFGSTSEAERYLKVNGHPKAGNGVISICCLGKRKTAYKYKWEYAN